MENSLVNKYIIDRSTPGVIKIKKGNDEMEFSESMPGGIVVKDCYIVRFEKPSDESMAGKIIQFTDLNGCGSEIVIEKSKFEEVNKVSVKDIEFDVDYFYANVNINMVGADSPQTAPIYVKIDENAFKN